MASGYPVPSPTMWTPACRTERTCTISGAPATPWPWMERRMIRGKRMREAGGRGRVGEWLCAASPTSRRRGAGAARGFTLIELLIVITIIGILITIAQPTYNRAVTSAKEAALKEDLFILRDRIDQFYADNGKYPASLNDLVEKPYLRRIPKDPITGSAETWTTVPATDEQGQQTGIFDVKSGSDKI